EPLAPDDRPRGEPGEHAGREYVQPDQGVIERQPRAMSRMKYGIVIPANTPIQLIGSGVGQPGIIKLVQPLSYRPDIRISGRPRGRSPQRAITQAARSAFAIPVAIFWTMLGVQKDHGD